MHVVQVIANSSTVPYFSSFAQRLGKYPGVKYSFVALYPQKPDMIEEMRTLGCDAYWIKFDHNKRKSGMCIALYRLYKLFRKLKPDAVNFHLFDDALPGLLAAGIAGVKIRVNLRQDTAFHWHYKPVWVWADRFNNWNSTHIVAPSGEARNFIMEKEKPPASKVYMIHSGVDLDAIRAQDQNMKKSLREKFRLEGKFVIGTVSRFIEWKGYRYIIEAAQSVVQQNNNIMFLFVGHGGQQQELQRLIEERGLNDFIQFVPWMERKYMPSLYGIMDVYLHAAIMEPFGFVYCEALANGVPVITTKTGIAADVLTHKETCYFVETKDGKSIADGINWMIAHPAERQAMSMKGRLIADERLRVEHMLDGYIKLYKGELKPD